MQSSYHTEQALLWMFSVLQVEIGHMYNVADSFGNMVRQIWCYSVYVSAGLGQAEHPHWICISAIESNSIPESVSLAHKHTQYALLHINVMLMCLWVMKETARCGPDILSDEFKALKSTQYQFGSVILECVRQLFQVQTTKQGPQSHYRVKRSVAWSEHVWGFRGCLSVVPQTYPQGDARLAD